MKFWSCQRSGGELEFFKDEDEEGSSISNNHSLQVKYAEENLWMHNKLQKTTVDVTPVNQQQETEALV